MSHTTPSASQISPWELAQAASAYATDAWQRTLLYADVRRQRGDQYRAHMEEEAPNVLNFPCEQVMSGAELPRPVNYGMVRILPSPDLPVDEQKRPFVVIDPRAGHGPGIGGFKPDSEIGAAMAAGHPCYFVGFLPDPVPGQTLEDVTRAFAAFVRRAAELHPDTHGKPAVVGNCQAGWQVLMAAALWPELFGPIIVAGAPLSYWAGDNPMRYTGGLLGGSWITELTSDLGAGRFDGAWLVQNFENLNPANTLWSKQYNLYANIDTEAQRYLEFERYWGGYVFLNDVEMQYIVDNLFIGNKLATAELLTSDGMRIDLRNIRSPIVVFSSYGDNITPPPQALGWITDLYRDDADVLSHNQTIVYATHDSIGHLGIFVSGSVGRKEHREFASNIDLIDLMPAGIYRATVDDHPVGSESGQEYLMSIGRSSVEEVRAIVQPDPDAERRFAASARVSEINLALYRKLMQPWVRAFSTPYTAACLQQWHPLRVSYEHWSSAHPLAPAVAKAAEQVREQRQPCAADNPFLRAQQEFSKAMESFLDSYRDHRDQIYASMFDMIYGSFWVQALTGQGSSDAGPVRAHPGHSPEHRDFIEKELVRLRELMGEGGVVEAGVRAVFYVLRLRGEFDERHFRHASHLHRVEYRHDYDLPSFRSMVREQALLMVYDTDAAIAAIPALLAEASVHDIRIVATMIEQIAHGSDEPLSSDEQTALAEMLELFQAAITSQAQESVEAKETTTDNADENANEDANVVPAPAEAAAKSTAKVAAKVAAKSTAKVAKKSSPRSTSPSKDKGRA